MLRAGATPESLGGVWAFYAPEAQQYLCPDTLLSDKPPTG